MCVEVEKLTSQYLPQQWLINERKKTIVQHQGSGKEKQSSKIKLFTETHGWT